MLHFSLLFSICGPSSLQQCHFHWRVTQQTPSFHFICLPSGLSAQINGQMIMPETVDGFIASVSALCPLNRSGGLRSHIFSLPDDCSVHLLVKKLARSIPQCVIWEEVEVLGIHVQGVMQLHSGCHNQDANKFPWPQPGH